ncbi:hypothetical protein [Streptococcus sp. DD13]|uniref:hypothetical protein n=1 Tax=Streptococcus sp. DD13 TaxID=1777881 RepID=UPI001E2AF42A|nr:hypothetical protein [Streptococcus sp. DD13]
MAGIHIVTYVLYRQNDIHPRLSFLLDGIWIGGVGLATVLSSNAQSNLQAFIMGLYLFLFGGTNLRDGLFFESQLQQNHLKRRLRVSLPLGIAALIPFSTLEWINHFLQQNSDEAMVEAYDESKPLDKAPSLEIFVHVSPDGFGRMGHVDLSYKGTVYSYGNYDLTSLRLFGTVGDGILFKAPRDAYVDFCNQFGKTLMAYQIVLTDEQERAVAQEIQELERLTVAWEPTDQVLDKDEFGKPSKMYVYRLRQEFGAETYKFVRSKFKTYFVMSTNCVLLADTIVGKAGTDLLGVKGFIAPGTYQSYLDREFERPYSMVVAREVFLSTKKEKETGTTP